MKPATRIVAEDGVVITVSAPEGVFPAGAELHVARVELQRELEAVDAAVAAKRDENVNVAVSYTFDIKVLDGSGNELQLAEGQSVNVSFEASL